MRIRKVQIFKLILRSLLFLTAVAFYIVDKTILLENSYIGVEGGINLLAVIWIFFVIDMLLRFFPSPYESMGCQKQFLQNFVPVKKGAVLTEDVKANNRRSVLIVALSWIALNAVIGTLYFTGVIDKIFVILIALFFSVCDIVCILFYCPFQSLMMKNRCCVSCRIYNWDFFMMFTPFIFVKSAYTWSLFALALILLIKWEITYHRHPERFSEKTNQSLYCANCKEHLCVHKKAIRRLARETKEKIYTDELIIKDHLKRHN